MEAVRSISPAGSLMYILRAKAYMNLTTYWIVLCAVFLLAIYTGIEAIPLFVLLFAPRLLKFWFISQIESERWINASSSVKEKIQQKKKF